MTTERGTGASRTAGARHQRRLAWTLALTGAFLVVEVATSYKVGIFCQCPILLVK